MPDKPSRRDRRRVSQRTGRRPPRPAPSVPQAGVGASPPPPTTDAPAGTPATPAPQRPSGAPSASRPSSRPGGLAPSAARAAAYLQDRQREIVRELRGLAVVWVVILSLFAAVTVLLTLL